ncbi:MAG: adenylate/guanylate cyclase domain-containing protein, partial [Verrucomicrobia bacterium]
MKLKPVKLAPAIIATSVILLVCLLDLARFEFLQRFERITYDWRSKAALQFPQPTATNLSAVLISDDSIAAINHGLLKHSYGLYWPRHIYGRMLRELAAQHARAAGFDVIFRELRPDHAAVSVPTAQSPEVTNFLAAIGDGKPTQSYQDNGDEFTLVESDEFFAWQLQRAGMAILASEHAVPPHRLFVANAFAIGDISADTDPDGVLRRALAFRTYTNWHSAFRLVEADPGFGVDLSKAQVLPGKIILPRRELEDVEIKLDADGQFDLADFGGSKLPPGVPLRAKPFTLERVWHMGIVLAARELGLDLSAATVDLPGGKIIFRSKSGNERVVPVDRDGYFLINWELPFTDPRIAKEPIEQLLVEDQQRTAGAEVNWPQSLRDKLVLIGSSATGNDLTDRGATPLGKATLLVSKHWNVANSLITGRFVRPVAPAAELLLIMLLGSLAAALTWQSKTYVASGGVVILCAVYSGLCFWAYIQHRLVLPLVLPLGGAVLAEYIMLVTYRVVFEQTERRRVKSVFSKIVAPDVVNELLDAETLSLGGARREVTVLFADVRGFTELADAVQARTAAYVAEKHFTGRDAEACFDQIAAEMLQTVSLYLGLIGDTVKNHGGTLDKYIGDCAMAFWGAPKSNPRHALDCVRAAIDSQRGIHQLNEKRTQINLEREVENKARTSAGLPAKALLPVLSLGTGINTGAVMVGLMGSDAHLFNYTVLGHEVNLASRLESV